METRTMQDSTVGWLEIMVEAIAALNGSESNFDRRNAINTLLQIGRYMDNQVGRGYDGLLPLDEILGEKTGYNYSPDDQCVCS